jgi:hypothetical protein
MKSIINVQFEQYFERIATVGSRNGWPYMNRLTLDELSQYKDFYNLRVEQVIAKAIIDIELENLEMKGIIRADAKVLLIINFSEMVYYPLTKSGEWNRYDLKKIIYQEVTFILLESIKQKEEVSSHKILEVGLKLWDRLKTTGKDSW